VRSFAARRAPSPLGLLAAPDLDRAIGIGAVMRLGATLAGATPGILAHCPLVRNGTMLRLVPSPAFEPTVGGEVSKRLGQAAKALALEWEIAA